MRYLIYGAGAIGGTIGGLLADSGQDVVLIARGAHLEALRRYGLTLFTPERELHPPVQVAADPAEARPGPGDVVFLTMKSQATAEAVDALAAVADPGVAVVCAQNGVENERLALRHFGRTYGLCVILPATHLQPGVVNAHGTPATGVLDLGCYPGGTDATAEAVSRDLEAAGFASRADPAVMRAKYRKLLMNLGNALDAAAGMAARQSELNQRLQAEAWACFEAAGIDVATEEEEGQRRRFMSGLRPAGGVNHQGSSSWQSLARGTGTIEADYLNGEVVLLGRLHGVATPVNEAVLALANRMARDGTPPGSVPIEQLTELVGG